MHQDTSRLRFHLQSQDFHYQELGRDAEVVEICERWPLLQAIYCGQTDSREPEDAVEPAREAASDTA